MQTFNTTHFGAMAIEAQSVIEFPLGMPGFEDCKQFMVLQHPTQPALNFLQSMETADLCFLALPVAWLRPDYQLAMAEEDLEALGLPPDAMPELGKDIVALAILSLVDGEDPTVNLLSPVVIHIAERRAVQAIRPDARYSCREPLLVLETVCS